MTTRPDHAAEARRLLTLIRPEGLTPAEYGEYLAFDNSAAIVAAAGVHATLALVEEQRTANLIAADTTDQLANPHEIGTPEYHAYWKAHTAALAERLAVQR